MKKYSTLGIVGLAFGIIAICCFLLSFILPSAYEYHISGNEYASVSSICPILFFMLSIIFCVLTIIFGAVAYWGKWKDKIGLADLILGFIVVIIWIVTYIYILSTTIYPTV